MTNQTEIRLRVPRPELDECQYFACDEKAVRQWVEELPIANLGQTSRQLYLALSQFNKVRLLPATRMAILEILRTPLYYVTRGLSKHYLNQPVVLPEQPRKVSELAHTLHHQLAVGYSIVATHTAALGKKAGMSKPEKLIGPAIHRAITDYTLNIQRHYQLYEPVNEGVWYNLHQFYLLAAQHNVLGMSFEDKEFGTCSVGGSYIRALLLGCAKPQQLRQEDLSNLFKPLTHWAKFCSVEPCGERTLFAIDPAADKPPVYRELYQSVIPPHWIGLNTLALVQHLQEVLDAAEADSVRVADEDHHLSRDLVSQIKAAWGQMSKRGSMRIEEHDTLDLCVGLSAVHHFISGELSFEALVAERGAQTYTMVQENPFMKTQANLGRQKDVWDSAFDSNVGHGNTAAETIEFDIQKNQEQGSEKDQRGKYRHYPVDIVNTSAHGYCVEWQRCNIPHLKPGEIVGVKESNSHNWSVATVRWVRRENSDSTQMGLELISPSAAPYGARAIRKTGGPVEWMRVLILPELPVTRQPVTLLTPRVPFKAGMKAILNQRGKEVQVRLDRKVNESGAYNRFEFHRISGPDAGQSRTAGDKSAAPEDEFDSLWGQL